MKVVFLDIDGVLNSEHFMLTLEEQHEQRCHPEPPRPKRATTCTCFQLDRQIDPAALARLNVLVSETGSQVVVSSSWRTIFDLPTLQRILDGHGLRFQLLDATPDGPNDPRKRALFPETDMISRGQEIDFWLRDHPEVECFVILDDSGDMAMHKPWLVQTDFHEGFLDEHVALATLMLTRGCDLAAAALLVQGGGS